MRNKATPKAAFLDAALRRFARNGFAATTTREITDELGLTPGALYYYFSSKTEILFEVLRNAYQPMLTGLDELLAQHRADTVDLRLAEAIRYTAGQFIHRQRELSIVRVEQRFLEPERQQEIRTILRAYSDRIRDLVTEGVIAGLWPAIDLRLFINTLFRMLDCQWYRDSGPNTPEEVADFHVMCAFRLLQYVPAMKGANGAPSSAVAQLPEAMRQA
jgi:AcrR family transcriptional regulator